MLSGSEPTSAVNVRAGSPRYAANPPFDIAFIYIDVMRREVFPSPLCAYSATASCSSASAMSFAFAATS